MTKLLTIYVTAAVLSLCAMSSGSNESQQPLTHRKMIALVTK